MLNTIALFFLQIIYDFIHHLSDYAPLSEYHPFYGTRYYKTYFPDIFTLLNGPTVVTDR
jgi:hypothetical protein